MATKKLKTLRDAFENSAFDVEPKGKNAPKEGSPKEEALDRKQQKAMPKPGKKPPFGGPGPAPFPPFAKKKK